MPIVDQAERHLIRTALDQTLVVEAAAGTGKTTELVNRIVAVLAAGLTTVDRLVAVTFTEKAAGELKLRLRACLDQERRTAVAGTERYQNIETALARLEEARAGTIHSFCTDLLREHPVEAGIDPEASPMDEVEAKRLFAGVFNFWLQQVLEAPPEGIRRALRRHTDEDPIERLRNAAWALSEWRDFRAPWTRPPFARHDRINEVYGYVEAFVDLTSHPANPRHPLYTDTVQARQLVHNTRASERTRPRDYDGLEASLVALANTRDFCKLRRTGYGTSFANGITKQQVLDTHAALVSALERLASEADADLVGLLHSDLQECIARYAERKHKLARLDFLDLLLRARDLVRDHPEVRSELQQQFTHIFIDEFQDTDPLQAEVLLLLSADDPGVSDWRQVNPLAGKLFIVGDPKQSIYRFRRADVGVYQQVRDMLVSRGASAIYLRTSFRSAPSIQKAVNAAFSSAMQRDDASLQADYVPLAPYRSEQPDQPTVVALSVPRPYSNSGRITQTAIEGSLPDATGAFIDWLLNESGWTVTLRGRDDRAPVAARHVCLLFRRFEKYGQDMAKPYADALQARGIPHVLVGGKAFHHREEVCSMRAALAAIEWPDDELSLFATLRGPFFAVPDHLLLIYREQFHRLHPFRVPQEVAADFLPVTQVLHLLAELHRSRNYRPVAQTITSLLNATRAHAAFALRPSGEQVLANVLHVAELARSYDAGGGISFRGFVEQLIADAEGGEAPEAAIYEEGVEGVRLMTVHRAKGLEFPVVVLADITAKIAARNASRYIDTENGLCAVRLAGWTPHDLRVHEQQELARDRAEGVRVAYVAATRARDLLIVPAVGDDPTGSGPPAAADWWTGPIHRTIYPPAHQRHDPVPAPQCPAFHKDSVLRPPDVQGPDDDTVFPGAHSFGEGESAYSVVWWDPRSLSLDRAPQFSLRQEQLLHRGDQAIIGQDLQRYWDWRRDRDAAAEKGTKPSLLVHTATEAASHAMSDVDGEVTLIRLSDNSERPKGPRFGTLVHATLAVIPLDAQPTQVEAAARMQGRILAAPDHEVEAAAVVVQSVIKSSLWQQAREAGTRGQCRRESPVTVRADDGALIEGIVDLAFLVSGEWIVVDFKTDFELDRALEQYRTQVSIYARAISDATSQPATAYLVAV